MAPKLRAIKGSPDEESTERATGHCPRCAMLSAVLRETTAQLQVLIGFKRERGIRVKAMKAMKAMKGIKAMKTMKDMKAMKRIKAMKDMKAMKV